MKYLAIFCCLSLLASSLARSQTYNIGISNGLKSNHVYHLLEDKQGYLWIATNKGVFRYNGYTLKNYDLSNGLNDDDIWKLYQDKNGRIWLSSISDHLSFIYNNNIHNVVIPSGNVVYPKVYIEYNGGIAFISPTINQTSSFLAIEKNDTILSYDLSKYSGQLLLEDKNTMLRFSNDSVFQIQVHYKNKSKLQIDEVYQFQIKDTDDAVAKADVSYKIGPNIVFYKHSDSAIYAVNLLTRSFKEIRPNDKPVYNSFISGNKYYATTDRALYEFDSLLHIANVYPYPDLNSGALIDPRNYSFYLKSRFWGNCWATTSNGLFLTENDGNQFKKAATFDLTDYVLVGGIGDSMSYWWNRKLKMLARINTMGNAKYYTFDALDDITKILPYNNDSSLLLSNRKIYWLNNFSGKLTSFYTEFNNQFNVGTKLFDTTDTAATAGAYDGVALNNRNFYFLSKVRGFANYKSTNTTLFIKILSAGRYKGIRYDSLRDYLWIYKSDDICVYKDNRKILEMNSILLKGNGIDKIENILTDRFGNIFIKDYKQLLLFNPNTLTCRSLFNDFTLENAKVCLKNNTLIIAGNFGVLFSKITASGMISPPLTYHNNKAITYNEVQDMYASSDIVLLKTDRGAFQVMTPADIQMLRHIFMPQPYKMILTYGQQLFDIRDNDTIPINRFNPKLQFDVINPSGVGHVRYSYRINSDSSSAWIELNTGDLNLPVLSPDNYYTLSLVASDEAWQSRTVKIHLYIIPQWWQKKTMQKWLWLSFAFLVAAMLTGIIYATRRIVIKSQVKRNKQLELELKAIHAQINPHFIYNTLSAAIYFINNKMPEQAVNHIHKFSTLLRAYVKSSRSKVITIADELINLRNYIELQQTRFQNRFDYEIIVDKTINPDKMKIPSLLLQPIVENAINHGLFHKKTGGVLKLKFDRAVNDNDSMVVTIDDNGIGRQQSAQFKKDNSESFGSELIKNLVEVFNAYENMRINMTYSDKELPETGTTVTIRITYL